MVDAERAAQLAQLAKLYADGVLDDPGLAAARARVLTTGEPESAQPADAPDGGATGAPQSAGSQEPDEGGAAVGDGSLVERATTVAAEEVTAAADAAEGGDGGHDAGAHLPAGPQFGPYVLECLIGQGGMGEVFRAFDTARGRVVALKRLPVALASDPTFQARFRSEAALAARLHEPHVIPIHDYGEIDGQLYIDMRLVEGVDLAVLLARDGPLAPERAVDVVGQVAAALDAAHAAGLVHRDIKPGNVLVTDGRHSSSVGAAGFVYVADFGIARATDGGTSGSLTLTGTTVGSLDYVAPERFGSGHGDHRADVYSLGCVLYEALTGQRPFPVQGLPAIINAHLNSAPPAPSVMRPGLPGAFDQVIEAALAKDPDERYGSAGALAAAALDALRGVSVAGVGPTPQDVTVAAPHGAASARPIGVARRRSSRQRRLAALAAAAAVVVLAAVVVTTQLLQVSDDPNQTVTEPGAGNGINPFMPPVTKGPMTTGQSVSTGGPVDGATPGLYGGTRDIASCDPAQMVAFLQSHPDKARAWAGVQGIGVGDIPGYVAALTPVVLRADTAVTNHGFADGAATSFRSVLQAGTAVLVDSYGVPRARCACGNPLTPAASVNTPHYTGDRWSAFDPARVVTVSPAAQPLTRFTLIDPASGAAFVRPIGTLGGSDSVQDQPATPIASATVVAQTPTQGPPEVTSPAGGTLPTAAVVIPPPVVIRPPVVVTTTQAAVAHAPVITGWSSYTEGVLVYLSIRHSDADGDASGFGLDWLSAPNHYRVDYTFDKPSYGRVSPGRVDYPFNQACGQAGQYESNVEAWVLDSTGRQSVPITAHLTCS